VFNWLNMHCLCVQLRNKRHWPQKYLSNSYKMSYFFILTH
jgi:hypothetical protein